MRIGQPVRPTTGPYVGKLGRVVERINDQEVTVRFDEAGIDDGRFNVRWLQEVSTVQEKWMATAAEQKIREALQDKSAYLDSLTQLRQEAKDAPVVGPNWVELRRQIIVTVQALKAWVPK